MTIRSARAEDEAAVTALWAACGLTVPHNDAAADFRQARGRPGSDVLVGAGQDGAILGSLMVGHDGHRGWLYYVACRPDRQGLGIGRAMVAAGEDWLRARGIAKAQLLVRNTNAKVVAFYERLGFAVAPRTVLGKWLDGSDPTG